MEIYRRDKNTSGYIDVYVYTGPSKSANVGLLKLNNNNNNGKKYIK